MKIGERILISYQGQILEIEKIKGNNLVKERNTDKIYHINEKMGLLKPINKNGA